jgi:hypothetical protein
MTYLSADTLNYDPFLSFSDNSPGKINEKLISTTGKELDVPHVFWRIGHEAYNMVRDQEKNKLTKEHLILEAQRSEENIQLVLDEIEKLEKDGRLTVCDNYGNTLSVSYIRQSNSLYYMLNFIDIFFESADISTPIDAGEKLLCCLISLNDVSAATCGANDCPEWLCDILDEMKNCVEAAHISKAVDKALSSKARNAAKARHAETYELKSYAINYYKENADRLNKSSRIKAAREIVRQIPVNERTADGWLKEFLQSARKL